MNVSIFTSRKTTQILTFTFVMVVLFLLVGINTAFGQETDVASKLNKGIQEVLWNVVANVFGWIVGIAGVVMNYAIQHYVIEFGDLFAGSTAAGSGAGVGAAVDAVWAGVRDIFNLTFIFALVYLGFKMILNSDDAGTRKWLANIIIAALLVNFSLFITKFIVDVSNVLAVEVYKSFPVHNDGISGTFMDIFGMSSVWNWSDTNTKNQGYMYIFGSAIVFLVTAFTFFSAGIMIMIRFIALNLYMAMSPVMFLGMVLPQFQSVTRKYWSGFLGRAFYAPVFLLLLYFSFMILSALTNFGGSANLAAALNGGGGQGGAQAGAVATPAIETAIVSFILGIGFLVASIQVAGKMSADGANTVMKVGNNLRGRVQRGIGGASAGLAGRGLRNTAGRYGNYLANDESMKRRAANSYLGQQAFRAAQGVAGASFDARRVGGIGKTLGVGEGQKGGFAKIAKDKKKREEDFLKAIETKEPDWNDPEVEAKVRARAAELRANNSELGRNSETIQKRTRLEELKKNKDARIAKKRAELEAATDTSEIDSQINGVDKEISDRTSNGELGTPKMQELIDKKKTLEAQKAAASNIEEELQKFVAGIEAEVTASVNDWADKEARNKARGSMRYANELSYRDQLKKSEKFWKSPVVPLGAAGGAVVGASAIGAAPIVIPAIGLAAGIAASIKSGSEASLSNTGWKAVEGKVGKDGTKGLSNEKKNKDLKALSEMLKDADGGDSKKDDSDKNDS